MKIFLIEWSTDILLEVAKQLQAKGADIIYLTGGRNQAKKEFPQAVFHSTYDAVKGLPALGVDCSGFEPLSKDFIRKFYECESQVLTMMNRMDYSGVSFYRRKRVYFQQLKYWKGVLEKFKPDIVVFAVAPHMVYDFVLYCAAKQMGIKTLMFDVLKLPDRLLPFSEISGIGQEIKEFLSQNPQNFKKEDLPEDLQNYYLEITDRQSAYYPFDIPGLRFQKKERVSVLPNFWSIIRSIREGDFFKKLSIKLKGPFGVFSRRSCLTSFDDDFVGWRFRKEKKHWTEMRQDFKNEYNSLLGGIDFKRKYIFLPLQYQPERSTSPMAGVFCEQILMVDILSKALPLGWLIYIKEHPTQLAEKGTHSQQGRYPGYYQALAQYPNVKLVAMETPSNQLILHAQAIATATGTAGWEAILKGKPALVFGWPFYQFAEGVFKISDLVQCQEALGIIARGYQVNQQKVLNFLYGLSQFSVSGRLGYRFEKSSRFSQEEAVENLTQAIYAELG